MCLVLNPCCVVMFGMFCVIYARITFSSVFAITHKRDIGLYDVPMLMSLLGLGTGMMLANYLSYHESILSVSWRSIIFIH